MFPRMPLPLLLTVTPHALYRNIHQRIHLWACLPLNFRYGACCVQISYGFLYYLCLIMPAHFSSVQGRTDDQYSWKAVPSVIMGTSGKSAVLLQMLLHPHYAGTWFKTECPFYLSIQLFAFHNPTAGARDFSCCWTGAIKALTPDLTCHGALLSARLNFI